MRLELSIKVPYVKNWGLWEAVRDLMQNGIDSEVQFSAPLSVWHDPKRGGTGMLCIENEGAVLPHEALLLGHTTKSDRGDLAGQFGEGLKLACLVLARRGHEVIIRSGSEVWTPCIERSEKFDADVLVVHIATGRKHQNRVRVEIGGISAEEWAEMAPGFRFLDKNKAKKDDVIETYAGSILLAPEQRGKIFVKGIFVASKPDYHVGFDFTSSDVKIDRDRKMVDEWDLKYRVANLWKIASASADKACADKARKLFVDAAFAGAPELRCFEDGWMADTLDEGTKAALAERFAEKFGDDAHPVTNMGDAMELEHLGKRGVQVDKTVAALVESKKGKLDTVKGALKNEVVEQHSLSDLTDAERNALLSAWAIMELAGVVVADDMKLLSIVSFRDQKLCGMFKGADGSVMLAKKELRSWSHALATLLHEFSHRAGGDGEHAHVSQLEEMWRKCIEVAMEVRA